MKIKLINEEEVRGVKDEYSNYWKQNDTFSMYYDVIEIQNKSAFGKVVSVVKNAILTKIWILLSIIIVIVLSVILYRMKNKYKNI